MKLLQTNFQLSMSKSPNQLDFLRVINVRGTNFFKDKKKLYKNLFDGKVGEQRVIDYIKKYGHSDWVVFQNVWLNHFGALECDLILITKYTIYIIEIKNYTGKFTYENGRCYYNNNETTINPIEQVRKNKVSLENILKKLYPHLKVQAVVIFTGDDNDVEIHSKTEDIQIINRIQIRNFILQIKTLETKSTGLVLNPTKIVNVLNEYEIINPFMQEPLTPDEMKCIRGGIYCANCHNFNLKSSRFYYECKCGLSESREEAIIRTVCDFGVLTYDYDIKWKDIINFVDNQASVTYIKKVINKHFTVTQNSSQSIIKNDNLNFNSYQTNRNIERPKIYHLDNQDFIIFKN